LGDADALVSFYHCLSRVTERFHHLNEAAQERFVQLMRANEIFCGVHIITYIVLSNHFHILVAVPQRPSKENLPTDEELVRLVEIADCTYSSVQLETDLKTLRNCGDHAGAEALREKFFSRMWNISHFMKSLKQRFTQWFNKVHERPGTLWEGRFKSILVEGAGPTLATIAAYIDLNAVRAGIVKNPEDFRWCGYAEALAGNQRARAGIAIAIEGRLHRELTDKDAMAEYRKYLFEEGVERKAGDDGSKARKGFSPERVEEVLKSGGKLSMFEFLRCKVRYFCDGHVIGAKAFVESFFQSNRSQFGPNRQSGSRPMRYVDMPGIYVARDLRERVVELSATR
jgi:REP element-mobilizing transposase RayT